MTICLYGLNEILITMEKLGHFAGVMNGSHNISIITLLSLSIYLYIREINSKYIVIITLLIMEIYLFFTILKQGGLYFH